MPAGSSTSAPQRSKPRSEDIPSSVNLAPPPDTSTMDIDRKIRSNTPLHEVAGAFAEQAVAGPSRITMVAASQIDAKDNEDDDDDMFAGLHDDPNQISSALPPVRSFPSSEELLDYLQKFGQDHGWALACNRSSINRKTIHWVCTRFGAYRSTRGKEYDEARKRKPRTLKADCKFAINGFRVRQEKTESVRRPEWVEPPQWTFTIVHGQHNHAPLSPMAITILRQRSLTPAIRQYINREIDLRTPNATILANLQNSHPEVLVRIKDIEGMAGRRRAQQRTYSVAAATIDRLQTDNELYHQIMGPNNTLFGLVYLKRTSRALLHRFPTVLFFDPTYATDVHGIKLLHIVGFTSMNTTFTAGFVFMLQDAGLWHEDAIKAFFALAGEPKAADGSGGVKGYITDDDPPLVYALRRQFPSARHLRCLSRLKEDIRTNTKQCWVGLEDPKRASEDFRANWTELIGHATSQLKLDEGYRELKDRYAGERYQPAIQFIEGFKDIHEQFVRFHTDSCSHFDQASNKGVEQQNFIVKKHLDTEPGDLFNVTVRLGTFLNQQWSDMLGEIDRQSATSSQGTSKLLLPLQGYGSSFALEEVHKQLRMAEGYSVTSARDIPACTGGYEKRMGMPCAHTLLKVVLGEKSFERKSIHYQWILGTSAWMKGFLTKVDGRATYVDGKTILDGRFTSGVADASNSLDPIEPVKVKRGRPPKSLEQRAVESALRTAAKRQAAETEGGGKRKRGKRAASNDATPETPSSPQASSTAQQSTFEDSLSAQAGQSIYNPSQIPEYSPTPPPVPVPARPVYPTWQKRAPSIPATHNPYQAQTSPQTSSHLLPNYPASQPHSNYYPHETLHQNTQYHTPTGSAHTSEYDNTRYDDGWNQGVYAAGGGHMDDQGQSGNGGGDENPSGTYATQGWSMHGSFSESRY